VKIIRRHINQSLSLILLLAAGVALVQMHDTMHFVEDIIVSDDPHEGVPDQESNHQECLNCTISFASTEFSSEITSPDYSSVTLISVATQSVATTASPYGFLLRAPPVG